MSMSEEAAKALRAPFPKSAIGKVPRKGTAGLDYVGHAAVTDRLLQVDPAWTWEPFATDASGAPLIVTRDSEASMWIRLTVCGVTRCGVGIVSPPDAFELEKQLISDALRNAAMRFGVALDLWARENLGQAAPTAPTVPEGWDNAEVAHEAHTTLRERISALSPEARQEIRELADGWPLSHDQYVRVESAVTLFEGGEEPF